ncbi:MAG: flagellar export protein FliJ [Oscillospiraceae bacterium]|nr:flagellar export protein FliJ [Oscillospiraceae bacterium]
MKKFVFSLQPVLNYKLTIEKQQKADLKKAQLALQELRAQEQRLLDAYAENERSLERALRENLNVATALSEHDAYFRFLRDALKEIRARIERAEQVVAEHQTRLIRTMREIKTYNKLRTEQYIEYQKEVQSEEEKEIGDLVSFNAVSEDIYS